MNIWQETYFLSVNQFTYFILYEIGTEVNLLVVTTIYYHRHWRPRYNEPWQQRRTMAAIKLWTLQQAGIEKKTWEMLKVEWNRKHKVGVKNWVKRTRKWYRTYGTKSFTRSKRVGYVKQKKQHGEKYGRIFTGMNHFPMLLSQFLSVLLNPNH